MIYANLLHSQLQHVTLSGEPHNESLVVSPVTREAVEALVLLLSPFAPHVCEECWDMLGYQNTSISHVSWPSYDEASCVDTTATVAIQINGKVRSTIELPIDLLETDAVERAMKIPNIQKYTAGYKVKKIVYVQGKIINIVLIK